MGLAKLQKFADGKIDVIQKFIIIFGKKENIKGKGESDGCQYSLLFQQCFSKDLLRVVKGQDCVKELLETRKS